MENYKIFRKLSDSEFREIASSYGKVIRETTVKIIPGNKKDVFRPDEMQWHSDCAQVRHLAWHCKSPGEVTVGTRVIRATDILEALDPEEVETLKSAQLAFKPIVGPVATVPVLSSKGFFFCYQHIVPDLSEYGRRVMSKVDWLTRLLPYENIELDKGDALILPNYAFIHSRGRVEPMSSRELLRLCIV